jgi:4'-phosphopantetheinyl transferase
MEIYRGSNAAWGIWKIVEDEHVLAARIAPFEMAPLHIHNPKKRLEYLAGRVLLKELLNGLGHDFFGLHKDEFGKPFLNRYPFQISLSHSYPYVAAIIDREKSVGIDLEQPKEKLLRIGPRVLHPDELADAATDIEKHCIYWCAKEALIKVHGKKDLVFSENMKISPFSKEKHGKIIGSIIVDKQETAIPLQYFVHEQFVVVLNEITI